LRLTPNTPGPKGGAWFPARQPVTHGFDTIIQFRITELVNGGADGLAFVIEARPAPVLAPA